MCSLVFSRLDYCNSLVTEINCDQICMLQKPLLKAHLWLPVKERMAGCQSKIIFNTATFDFHFFHGATPPDLSSCPSVYTPSRTLHSSSDEKGTHPEIIRVHIYLKSCLSWFSRHIVYNCRSKCRRQKNKKASS